MKNARLFTPGPTAVPDAVLETQARPLIHHRTEDFKSAHLEVLDNLRYIMRTKNPVAVLSSSGTGAMEAAVVNLTKPGEKVIVTEVGKFSQRWRILAETYGVHAVSLTAAEGEPVSPDQVAAAFDANPDAVALLTTHSETSSCILQDVESFASIAHDHNALIVVDGITSIGAHDVYTDKWGLDALVGGSQKGVMIPPGLGYITLSERAVEKMKAGRHPVFYFDLIAAISKAESGDTPYTPAITLFLALQTALRMMREEGIENIVSRHAANAGAVRAAVDALGLKQFPKVPSNAATAVIIPDGLAGRVTSVMEKKHDVKIAGGQNELKGKIVRLGHLGYYYRDDMKTLIGAFEATLLELGIISSAGAGVEALERSYEGAGV